jgi:hypothetical protein
MIVSNSLSIEGGKIACDNADKALVEIYYNFAIYVMANFSLMARNLSAPFHNYVTSLPECATCNKSAVTFEKSDASPIFRTPKSCRFVARCGRKKLSLGGESNRHH